MPDLNVILGTINFTDYIRVSAEKVGSPGVEVWNEYFDVPVSNLTFVIPNLEASNYYLNFRDAPDLLSLGTLVTQAFVNALTGEWISERRFYTIGALPGGVSSTINNLTDPYLIGKNITGIFKENFRYLEVDTEFTFDDVTGGIDLLGDQTLSATEKFIVEIKYNVGTSSTTIAAGMFSADVAVTPATYSILSVNKFKRHLLNCTGTKQAVTLPTLSSCIEGDFFLLEHKRDGVQLQTKILVNGSDKIYFNGFSLPGGNLLTELWVNKGKSLYFRKTIISATSYWEVVGEYDGVNVGTRQGADYSVLTLWLPETGLLCDGDELPALYWYIRNVLPSTHYVTDDTVSSGGYAHPSGREGQFVIHSTGKAFRLPNTQGFSEKGLKDFLSYGAGTDTTRIYNYPGGSQLGSMKKFWIGDSASLAILKVDGTNTVIATDPNAGQPNIVVPLLIDKTLFGDEVIVKNTGVIYCRHI